MVCHHGRVARQASAGTDEIRRIVRLLWLYIGHGDVSQMTHH